MAYLTALFDACVLYSDSLRILMMHLTVRRLYRARWTEQIHDEWMRHLLENRPALSPEKLERTRNLMNENAPDSLVTGYEALIPCLVLPDPDDRDVLAAAITGRADVIVTFDLGHFPNEALASYGVEAQHPDVFLSRLFHSNPALFCQVFKAQRLSMKNPPFTVDERLTFLEEKLSLPGCVSLLREMKPSL
jgi:hypothetical protein